MKIKRDTPVPERGPVVVEVQTVFEYIEGKYSYSAEAIQGPGDTARIALLVEFDNGWDEEAYREATHKLVNKLF